MTSSKGMDMRFKASESQVRQMAANAANAATPTGLGLLQFDPAQVFVAGDIPVSPAGIFLDYFAGRMVKLMIDRKDGDVWEIIGATRLEYQSWARTYPTFRALANSVPGVEVLP